MFRLAERCGGAGGAGGALVTARAGDVVWDAAQPGGPARQAGQVFQSAGTIYV